MEGSTSLPEGDRKETRAEKKRSNLAFNNSFGAIRASNGCSATRFPSLITSTTH